MKDIKGYEGLYAITSCGRVWSYRRKKFLTPTDDGRGYEVVTLCKDGKTENKRIHRLVAETYLPNPENLPEVDHIIPVSKGGKNNVQNLQWILKKDNIKKAVCKKIYCFENGKIYESQTQAARELGLDQGNISKVCRGIFKQTGGYHFEFVIEEENSMEKIETIINKFPEDLKNDTILTAAEICYDEGIITYDEFNYVMKYLDEVND